MRSVRQCKSSAATCRRLTFHPAAWRRHGASGPHFILGFTRPVGASHSCQRLGVKRTWRRVSAVLVHTAKSPRIVGAPMAPPYHAETPRIRQPQPRIRQVRCANSLAQVGRCCGRIKRKTAVLAPAPSVNLHVSERATRSTAARRLTLRSRGRAPAGRLSLHFILGQIRPASARLSTQTLGVANTWPRSMQLLVLQDRSNLTSATFDRTKGN